MVVDDSVVIRGLISRWISAEPDMVVAASLRTTDGRCDELRIALGAAATVPVRARKVEGALRGEALTPERIRDAAALVREEVDPLDDLRGSAGYKREMARVWTERALLELANAAAR